MQRQLKMSPDHKLLPALVLVLGFVFAAPHDLAAQTHHVVCLTFNASPSPNIHSYTVFRSSVSGSGYVQIGRVGAQTLMFQDDNVTRASTYYYVLKAVDTGTRESGFSNEAVAVVPDTDPSNIQQFCYRWRSGVAW